jgi:hypothetical protein
VATSAATLSCPHRRHRPRHQGQPSPLPLTPRAMSKKGGCFATDGGGGRPPAGCSTRFPSASTGEADDGGAPLRRSRSLYQGARETWWLFTSAYKRLQDMAPLCNAPTGTGLHLRRPSNYHDYSPSYKRVCWPRHHLLQPHHPMRTSGRGTMRGCTARDSLAASNTNVGLHGPASEGCCVFTSVVPTRALLFAVQRFLGTQDDACSCSIFRIIKR